MPKLAYFLTDFCEKLYDDSLEALNNPSSSHVNTILMSTTSPTITGNAPSTPITTTPTNLIKKSPSSNLPKISSRKIDIVQSIKPQLEESDLSCVLLIYLVIGCFEINDWINLKILLPEIKFPANNSDLFQKWFLYQFFNILNEKSVLEQFKNEWFVKLIFDEFLVVILKQKFAAQTPISNESILFYEQVAKFLDKLCPHHVSPVHASSVINEIKPNESVIFSLSSYSRFKLIIISYFLFKTYSILPVYM